MGLEIKHEKEFDRPAAAVYQAALKAVAGLEGRLLRQQPERGELEAKFDKKILGQLLGDRTQLTVRVLPTGEAASRVLVEAYPIDAVGRKQLFGARKGVTQTVLTWFLAHLEHHLAAVSLDK